MSLERIDQHIRELKAIRDYPTKCQELNEAWSLTSHLQKELNGKEKIISLYKDRIKKQNFSITNLENALREAREEVSNLGKGQIQHNTKKSDHFKDSRPNDFVALGISITDS